EEETLHFLGSSGQEPGRGWTGREYVLGRQMLEMGDGVFDGGPGRQFMQPNRAVDHGECSRSLVQVGVVHEGPGTEPGGQGFPRVFPALPRRRVPGTAAGMPLVHRHLYFKLVQLVAGRGDSPPRLGERSAVSVEEGCPALVAARVRTEVDRPGLL